MDSSSQNLDEDGNKAGERSPDAIRAMFARIASAYDLNNRLHSLGRDQAWRKAALRQANLRGSEAVLDVACGTGDLTVLFRRQTTGRVVGCDFCDEMLHVAQRKFPGQPIEWIQADAHHLPFPDGSFDVVSIAFGLRNLHDPRAALTEFRRLLRPGGQLVLLEFTRDARGLGGRLIRWFTCHVMVHTAATIARDRGGAYHYLHNSVQSFLSAPEMAAALREASFDEVRACELTFSTVALLIARRT